MTDAPALTPRTLPPLSDVNRAFWTGGKDGQLLILRCPHCGMWVHPPAAECPKGHGALTPEAVSGKGTVFSFTIARHSFNPSVPLPYVVAIVELVEQKDLRFMTNVVNCEPESVRIDMPVHVLFEDYGTHFVPVFEPD